MIKNSSQCARFPCTGWPKETDWHWENYLVRPIPCQTGEWCQPSAQSWVITLPKKSYLQHCQNYRTISFISHPSKVMLKIILNKIKPKAEKIIAEEQAGVVAGRSTTEQIFKLRNLCEKYLQHQQDLYHVFIDFRKAIDRVWHVVLWATIKKYKISASFTESSNTSTTRPLVQSSLTAAYETRSEQRFEPCTYVYVHPSSEKKKKKKKKKKRERLGLTP